MEAGVFHPFLLVLLLIVSQQVNKGLLLSVWLLVLIDHLTPISPLAVSAPVVITLKFVPNGDIARQKHLGILSHHLENSDPRGIPRSKVDLGEWAINFCWATEMLVLSFITRCESWSSEMGTRLDMLTVLGLWTSPRQWESERDKRWASIEWCPVQWSQRTFFLVWSNECQISPKLQFH